MAERLVSRYWGEKGSHTFDFYLTHGGYSGLRRALTLKPEEITDVVRKSAIRGRGGARFPTGVKWAFIPKGNTKPVYLVVNADEGEPGTFKDRHIMEKSPHMLVEGIIIAARAVKAKEAFVYIRGEYAGPAERLKQALAEAEAAGYIGESVAGTEVSLRVSVVMGAGAYICGEETALLTSIEGGKGHPKLRPPFPAVSGLYSCPTIVNNVETLAYLPHIMNMGGEAFAALGSPRNGGLAFYGISGHVKEPGVLELPMGTSLRDMIFTHCGGIRGDRRLKAVLPGGSSSAVLTADEINVKMDSESLAAAGSMLGSGGVIVMDETTCMVRVARNAAHFYASESCGQCSPCREGTAWIARLVASIEKGEGEPSDVDLILNLCERMAGKTICPLADGAVMPIASIVRKFRQEFLEHLDGKCRGVPPCSFSSS